MRVLVYCYGSRGDVEPFVALSHGLRRAGHDVVLAGPRRFAEMAEARDVMFRPLNDDSLALMERPDVQRMFLNDDARDPAARQLAREIMADNLRSYPRVLADMAAAADDGADVVLHTQASGEASHQIAEMLGVPAVLATLYPNYAKSWHYPSPLLAGPRLFAKPLNRLSHVVAWRWPPVRSIREMAGAWRERTLRLPPRRHQFNFRHRPDGGPTPIMHCFSRYVLPPAPDWGTSVFTTGFWHLPIGSTRLAPSVADFLAAGEKPVFVGFGSMIGEDPRAAGVTVQEAVRARGLRAIVVRGWGGIDVPDPREDILVVDDVPYDLVLPHVAAAVHAGGAGTMNSALRAGLPQVPFPFHGEQVFWASVAHRLGIAVEPVRQRELTVAKLVRGIEAVLTDKVMAARADHLAAAVATEDWMTAVERALDAVARASTLLSRPRG
jgi:sterol 3beta-glucosyltransferase